jgi:acetyltransferase
MHASAFARPAAPYAVHRIPTGLIEPVRLNDGRSVMVRPVLPQDAELQQAFVRALSPQSRRLRFHGPVAELPDSLLRYMTEVDFDSHVALLAEVFDGGEPRQVAEARWVRREDEPKTADFALAVADDWQRSGLGTRMLRSLERSARGRGIQRLSGDVMANNAAMVACMRSAGWQLRRDPHDASALLAEIELIEPAWREAA